MKKETYIAMRFSKKLICSSDILPPGSFNNNTKASFAAHMQNSMIILLDRSHFI
jgi:hypothetical protein